MLSQTQTTRLDHLSLSTSQSPALSTTLTSSTNSSNTTLTIGTSAVTASSTSAGIFFLTNFRCIFRDYARGGLYSNHTQLDASCDIPLNAIHKCQRLSSSSSVTSSAPLNAIRIITKDHRRCDFAFDSVGNWVDALVDQIRALSCPRDQQKLFAFDHFSTLEQQNLVPVLPRPPVQGTLVEFGDDAGACVQSSSHAYPHWMLHWPVGLPLPIVTPLPSTAFCTLPSSHLFKQQQPPLQHSLSDQPPSLFASVTHGNTMKLLLGPAAISPLADSPLSLNQYQFNGWMLYDPIADYQRCGLASDKNFRLDTKINANFELCSTYPPVLVVPQSFNADDLKQVASHRSRERLPAVVWQHPITRATMSRCAQPLVG